MISMSIYLFTFHRSAIKKLGEGNENYLNFEIWKLWKIDYFVGPEVKLYESRVKTIYLEKEFLLSNIIR